jgi:hypothetical protein
MLEVANMKRQALIGTYQTIRKKSLWPAVRKTGSRAPRDRPTITMDLDDLDIANRKLHLLLAFYEHKRKSKFASKEAVARAGSYNAAGPLMLRIYGPGGVAAPARSALEADLDEVAEVAEVEVQEPERDRTRVQDHVEAHDSESERASTDSDDEEAASRVAKSTGRKDRKPSSQTVSPPGGH